MYFLNSCSPDHQPPLYLSSPSEIIGDVKVTDVVGEAEVDGLAPLKFEGLSQVGFSTILSIFCM